MEEKGVLLHQPEPEKFQAKTVIGFVLVMKLVLDQCLVSLDGDQDSKGMAVIWIAPTNVILLN